MNRVAHPVRALFLVVALLVLLRTPLRAADDKSPEVYAPVVNATNHFAVKFFKASYEESPQKNVITAPASLSYSFALLLNGAQGAGRDQIADVFDFKNIPLDQINQGNAALRAIRTSHAVKKPDRRHPYPGGLVGEDGRSFQPYLFAGGLWLEREYCAPEFGAVNTGDYGYFWHQQRPTAASINRWAALATHGKLASIAPDDIAKEDFVLATVLYFKSRWVSPFSLSQTHPGQFTLLSGTKKEARMMVKRDHDFQYLKGPNFQAVKLYFYQAAMFIVLPDEDSTLQTFVDKLTPESWQEWSRQFRKHEGYLELPRFEIDQKRDTKPVLQKMGMTVPFERYSTFIPMVGIPEGAKLRRVLEGTSMKVDETGAEIKSYGIAAGVLGGIAANPPPPFRMIVDRPFFFAVIDTRTDQTLFMGTVVEP